MAEFEWDEEKAEENLDKHGILFGDAKFVFDDPLAIHEQNRIVGGEQRWQVVGRSKTQALIFVVYTVQENGAEIYRIISARPLKPSERRDYGRSKIQRR